MSDNNNDKEEMHIPLLDGTNYAKWYLCMLFLLRSKELLEVCKNPIGQDASTTARNRWNKLSFEAITLITSRINHHVFLEVVQPETSDEANLLWICINENYASKRNMIKGRVFMNWKKLNYIGDLQSYINSTGKFPLDLQSVSVKLPPEILAYIILGKIDNKSSLTQVVEILTLNDSLLKKPDQVRLRLQEYANLQSAKTIAKEHAPISALISSSEHQFKVTHFCSNGIQNPKRIVIQKILTSDHISKITSKKSKDNLLLLTLQQHMPL
ncbi:hypothetical protein O181_089894 [Austropuccinia psidii MF-1]|uniref:DUF4219 domain-containing protein n=1 Tax=Austropuccinia psidii MF-1 TaxID=1389203 RepID=A0A9Q3IUI9_9BASI|nr:hypothetical protein [Austropuccinia psidii MF-1]